jgi:hypothetical protein
VASEHTVMGMANISHVLTVPAALRSVSSRSTAARPAARSAIPLVAVCALAAALVVTRSADADSATVDAAFVSVTALAGVALAALRWTPDQDVPAWRPLTVAFAVAIVAVAAGLVGAVWIPGVSHDAVIGPAITSALVATYLVTWGFRSQPLLRTVAVFSLLAWTPVATTAREVVHASLQTPSELVYRRLAELRIFGIADEPWRLFTAELHRGTLVVIATVVLGVVLDRRKASLTTAVEVFAAACAALVVHHAIVLASPIDQFAADAAAPLATTPAYELGTAVLVAVALVAVRQLRRNGTVAPQVPDAAHDELAARDPIIFGVDTGRRRLAVALTFSGLAPLLAVALTA